MGFLIGAGRGGIGISGLVRCRAVRGLPLGGYRASGGRAFAGFQPRSLPVPSANMAAATCALS
jgi:hypothetical protein